MNKPTIQIQPTISKLCPTRFSRRCLQLIALASCTMISLCSHAQEQKHKEDSVKTLVKKINRLYPGIRPYSFQIEQVASRPYKTDYFDQSIEKGDITETFRAKAYGTSPSFKKGKFIVYGTFSYLYQKLSLRNSEELSPSHPEFEVQRNLEMHDLNLSINNVYKDSLFNRPLVVTAALTFNARNFKSVEKLRGLVTAAIVLRANRNTIISTGIIANIDPNTMLPVLPLVSYWHRFPGEWQVDVILPNRLYIRHPMFKKGWFSLGTEVGRTHSFRTPDQLILRGDYEITSILLQTGVNIEYPISKNFLLGFRTGMETTLNSRMVKVNHKFKDYVSSSTINPAAFFNVSIAFVPGLKNK